MKKSTAHRRTKPATALHRKATKRALTGWEVYRLTPVPDSSKGAEHRV